MLGEDLLQLVICHVLVDVQHEVHCVLAVLEEVPAVDVVVFGFAGAGAEAHYPYIFLTLYVLRHHV